MTLHPERLSSTVGVWAIVIACAPTFLLCRIWPNGAAIWLTVAAAAVAAAYFVARACAARCTVQMNDSRIVISRGLIFRRRTVIPRCSAVIFCHLTTPADLICGGSTVIIRAGLHTAVVVGLQRADAADLLQKLGCTL